MNRRKPRKIKTGKALNVNILKSVSRFWSKVDRAGDDECWPFMGRLDEDGYGRFDLDGLPRLAHRVSYVLSGRKLRSRLDLHHTCHYRPCCNPKHLKPISRTRHTVLHNEMRIAA